MSKRSRAVRTVQLTSQAKPQLFILNKHYTLLWFKNVAQLQVVNNHTMAIEQTMFLPRNENWLQVNLASKKGFVFEICMRNIKTLNFYELNLESHPFSFRLTSKQPATNEFNHMTHMSYVSPSSICNIMNYGDCLEHLQLFIRQREGND